ncbi:BRCT domain-containing protein [Mannheimia bovis]|uniref:BRCT domain-containing protein n=1 Tax=Mannheimia bovis TaxID=2770636 RepID=A0A7H1BZV5_9PAST|nr:BRCT domain-containing protein [Mannheimia bovis]QNS14260.1 hypothetical protein ICJ55_05655 [Mannheimia bovis]
MDILLFFIFAPSFSFILPRYWKQKRNLSYWLGVPLGIFLGLIIGGLISSQIDQKNYTSSLVLVVLFTSLFIYCLKGITHKKLKDTNTAELTKPNETLETSLLSGNIQFWYTDSKGNSTLRNVKVVTINNVYLEAFDLEKKGYRTFRLESINNEIIDISTGEILSKDKWLESNKTNQTSKYNYKSSKTTTNYNDNSPHICFTGFPKVERELLEALAELNGYRVRKSITKNLNYLVCGNNAGPAKIIEAERRNAEIISEKEFLSRINK